VNGGDDGLALIELDGDAEILELILNDILLETELLGECDIDELGL
jgi:hypothetical protein